MSAVLLDLNVLVVLAWPTHEHHVTAQRWFQAHGRDGWASCLLTQLGFVRLSMNPKIVHEARSGNEAVALLHELTGLSGHRFWKDNVPPYPVDDLKTLRPLGHRQVTDRYLLNLARRNSGRLATFDRDLGAELSVPERKRWIEMLGRA